MTDRPLRAVAPALYRSYLPAFFDNAPPREEKATCQTCAMLAPPGVTPSRDRQYFRPDTKCCTYHPMLPNYLVGAALSDPRPEMDEGRRRLRARIASRVSVSPRWVSAPRKMDTILKSSWVNIMGRSLVLRCPLYSAEHGGCTIWPHWDSVCASFFCKYMKAADGEALWRAVRNYLSYVERRLAIAAARAVLPGRPEEPDPHGPMTIEDLEDRPPSEESYAELWGDQVGREEEHYIRCHEWVGALSRGEFERIVQDAELERRMARLEQTWETLQHPTLPETLVRSPDLQIKQTDEGVLVRAYSPYEPLLLTKDLFDLVLAFDGKETVAELVARMKREADLEIPEDMLLSLYQYRVLVTPAQAEAARERAR
jgi:hypothetical protein